MSAKIDVPAALICAGAITLSGSEALGDPVVAVSPSAGMFIADYARAGVVTEVSPAFVADFAIGFGIDAGELLVVPEVGGEVGYLGDSYERLLVRAHGGARLATRDAPAFHVFMHGGYAQQSGVDSDALLHRSGFGMDAGAGLLWPVATHFAVGPRLTWATLQAGTGSGTDGTHWVVLGLEAAYWSVARRSPE